MKKAVRTRRAVLTIVCIVAGVACGDGPTEPGSARLRLIDPGAVSDTVLALPGTPIIVQALDSAGRPAQGVIVRFIARPPAEADDQEHRRGVYVCAFSEDRCAVFYPVGYSVTHGIEVRTDSTGRARARVQFGVIAGAASIEVSQPSVGISLDVNYTTLVGALAQVTTPTVDTAVYVGSTYELGARAADQFGNPRSETVTFTSLTPTVVTVEAGRATAAGLGRGRIRMQAATVIDTAFVSVPPVGRLVSMGWSTGLEHVNRLTLVNTDGSARRVLLESHGVNGLALPTWTPDGAGIVIQQSGETFEGQLRAIDTLGGQRQFLTNQNDFERSIQPTFAGNGSALFFYGYQISSARDGIFRVGTDGLGATFLFAAVQPAPSPDATKVAYVSGDSLFVRDLASEVVTPLAFEPVLPRWSPAGDLIAYVSARTGAVHVIRPDGSEPRQLGGTLYDLQVAWSPDGDWLAVSRSTGIMEIIRVSDGERLPIAGTWGLHQLSWRR